MTREVTQVVGCKNSIGVSITIHIYISYCTYIYLIYHHQLEEIMGERIPFKIAPEKIKYLRINLTRNFKPLCSAIS